jgi:hypothetical protein
MHSTIFKLTHTWAQTQGHKEGHRQGHGHRHGYEHIHGIEKLLLYIHMSL